MDSIPTIILSIKGVVAKGFTINKDLTTDPVYIVRVGNSFAHGKTAKEAHYDAQAKHLLDSPVEERINLFLETFKDKDKIPAKDLYQWHFNLTGSCSYGRYEFVKSKGIDTKRDSFTIHQFIDLTIDQYGGDVIKQLKETIENEH